MTRRNVVTATVATMVLATSSAQAELSAEIVNCILEPEPLADYFGRAHNLVCEIVNTGDTPIAYMGFQESTVREAHRHTPWITYKLFGLSGDLADNPIPPGGAYLARFSLWHVTYHYTPPQNPVDLVFDIRVRHILTPEQHAEISAPLPPPLDFWSTNPN